MLSVEDDELVGIKGLTISTAVNVCAISNGFLLVCLVKE